MLNVYRCATAIRQIVTYKKSNKKIIYIYLYIIKKYVKSTIYHTAVVVIIIRGSSVQQHKRSSLPRDPALPRRRTYTSPFIVATRRTTKQSL